MIVDLVNRIKVTSCKSLFLSKLHNKNQLPQYQEFCTIMSNNLTTALIINDGYCSLVELDKKIITASQSVTHYFYLAINKFYIYSDTDLDVSLTQDYDSLLVDHCYNLIKDQFELVSSSIRLDDHGQLGNFVHPVTTMVLKRHDKTSN